MHATKSAKEREKERLRRHYQCHANFTVVQGKGNNDRRGECSVAIHLEIEYIACCSCPQTTLSPTLF